MRREMQYSRQEMRVAGRSKDRQTGRDGFKIYFGRIHRPLRLD